MNLTNLRLIIAGLLIAVGVQASGQTDSSEYAVFVEHALEMRDYRKHVPEDSLVWAIKGALSQKNYPLAIKGRIVLGSQWVRNDQLDKGDSIFTIAWKECDFLEGKSRTLSATVLSEIANIQYIKGNLDSTWVLQHMVYDIDKEFKDTQGMIIVLHNISNAANSMGKDKESMESLLKALELSNAINDTDRLAPILVRMGFQYHGQDNYRMAIKTFKEALEAITERSEHVSHMTKLGIADALIDSGNFEVALETAHGVLNSNPSPRNTAFAHTALADIYIAKGDSQAAVPHLLANYNYGKESGIPYFSLDAANKLGILEYRNGNLKKARMYLEEARDINESYKMLRIDASVTRFLTKLSIVENRPDEGIKYLNKLIELHDSLSQAEQAEKAAEAQKKFENQLTERENAFLSEKTALQESEIEWKNKLILAISALSVLLLVFVVVVALQRRAVARKNEQLDTQNKLIAQQAEELRMLDKQKNTFFANVSHELRTPLTLILGPLEKLLSQEKQLSRASFGNLTLAHQGTQRLRELVEEILDVTRLNNEKLKLNLKAEDFKRFIHRSFHAFESMAELKEQRFTLDYQHADTKALLMDRDKVEKVISNLISNAFKFSPAGTEVKLTVVGKGSQHTITVTDQGPGLKEAQINKIFERSYQNQDGYQGGLGIGLWLAKELALLMKGDLEAANNPEGGASFTFTFTAEETEAPTLSSNTIPADTIELPELAMDRKAHVLVVEDNPEMREFINDILSPYFVTYNAGNGQEALEVLNTREVDLITSDVMMPGLGGYELLSEIRSAEKTSHIPFIMITARSDEESRIHALQTGVDDYIIKPFLARELIIRVHSILKNYLLRRTAKESEDLQTADEQLSQVLEKAIDEHLADSKLSAERLSELTAMSERSIYRQIKSIFGMTPAQFIKEKRLDRARKILMSEHRKTVSEVAFSVGYGNARTFSKHFFDRHGKYPSEYLK